jgi:O-methyltransferase
MRLNDVSEKVQTVADLARSALLWRTYREHTMVVPTSYVGNLSLAARVLRKPGLKNGCIVECGTWRGGMAAGLIAIGGPHREYFFFDSFAGLPPAEAVDGEAARAWQADPTSPHYHDNCAASFDDFMQLMSTTACPGANIHVFRGWFEDTFPRVEPKSIAVLRLDADWYAPTMACLEKFWPHLLPGGIALIDDYYHWVGCRRAVHDFLSRRSATEAITRARLGGVVYITKQE